MPSPTPIEIGGEPVVTLERGGSADPSRPSFRSAQILPGRGMMTLQIRAHLPSRGEIDLLASPSADMARPLLDDPGEEFPGNATFSMGGAILLPFANRIRGALSADGKTLTTSILGRKVTLPANWGGQRSGAERYAMHGLILASRVSGFHRETTFEEDRLKGTFEAGDFGGHWPSATEVTFKNTLRDDSFTLTVTARNVGDEPLPMGIGWHPYFALPSSRREQALLHLPARKRTLVNDYDEVLPTGEVVPTAGTLYDFSAPGGRPLGTLYLDDCFVDLERTASGHALAAVAEIVDPEADFGLRVLAATPHVQAFQVYGPVDKGFLVLEPQFNWADPFGPEWGEGVDTGMAILAPGEAVTYAARLELFMPKLRR